MATTHSAAGPPHIGSYEIFGRLAEGRDTVIWAATLRRTRGFVRTFAIKSTKAQAAALETKRAALFREAAIGGVLDHPALGRTVDVGIYDSRPYLVCELIRGWSLRSVMATASLTRIPIPLAAVLSILHKTAEGIHYLHEVRGRDGRSLGLVHRAIDDGNVMVARPGYTKLIDFGLATPSAVEAAPPLSGADVTEFSAPEVSSTAEFDRRADVFSLGALLDALSRRMPTECPKDLRAVISRATAEQPRNRFGNARDFQRSLEAVAMARDIPLSTSATTRFLDHLFATTIRPGQHGLPGLAEANRDARPEPSLGRTRVRVTRPGRSQVSQLSFSRPRPRRHTTGC